MAVTDSAAPAAGHRRNKSASVLKSMIISKSHKRAPSDGTSLNPKQLVNPPYLPAPNLQTPLLPPDHPHSQLRAAGRNETIPTEPVSPRKPQDARSSPNKGLHKKTLSSVSLQSLAKKEEKHKDKQPSEARLSREEETAGTKPKKTKSSTNLAAMFGKSRRDRSPVKEVRDKENTTPPTSANAPAPARPPIWAEFSSQQEVKSTTRVPLNDQRRSIEEEIALYTPQDYSPSKQRNFFEYGQPSLQQRPVVKERPKSMVVPKTTSTTSLLETFSRKKSNARVPLSDTKGNGGRIKESASAKSIPARPVLGRASTDISRQSVPVQAAVTTKKPNRVMAAVAAFNGKSRQPEAAPTSPTKLDPKVVDAEFEDVLVSKFSYSIGNWLILVGITKHPNPPT